MLLTHKLGSLNSFVGTTQNYAAARPLSAWIFLSRLRCCVAAALLSILRILSFGLSSSVSERDFLNTGVESWARCESNTTVLSLFCPRTSARLAGDVAFSESGAPPKPKYCISLSTGFRYHCPVRALISMRLRGKIHEMRVMCQTPAGMMFRPGCRGPADTSQRAHAK
jgi:hypothetical protein